ncbi:MAG: hypothetical protein UY48_C0003G0108 [Candidatus Gottesmanbacteria bacterium GW2011_GWB1_49_7]|uniref:Uncharacterized protein n=1 Tax=Candidatus Gottesmanbacteria bacterium GW2011_GWB1_49_7 TaxID=1618448 RepID=A0A0G1W3F0_9BACT|nr:MAG: hypothetical protein UY48_C0003G0108 [Candidatus Gottesmanbacteria bacterium GW2011_GWB1_49_7]
MPLDNPNPTLPVLSPRQQAQKEAQDRITAARDQILVALSNLHPEEQLDAAQATLNTLRVLNERSIKKQQLEKLKAELGDA